MRKRLYLTCFLCFCALFVSAQALPQFVTLAWTPLQISTPALPIYFIVWQSNDLTNWIPVAITAQAEVTVPVASSPVYFSFSSWSGFVVGPTAISDPTTPIQYVSISVP